MVFSRISSYWKWGLCAYALALGFSAHANSDWPNKPIKMVVPFAAGGSNDALARLLAMKLGQQLNTSVVVENKGGGGGVIGASDVAKSTADGYTILFASTTITTNEVSGKKLPYDLKKDFESVVGVASTPFVVTVNADGQFNTLADLVNFAKKEPGAVNYASAGIGGINHIGTEILASILGVEFTHVPYKGIAPGFTDLLGGNIQMMLPTLVSVIKSMEAGRVKGLAITTKERAPSAPDIPTLHELGYELELYAWFGLMTPAGTPEPIRQKLYDSVQLVLKDPEFQQQLERESATPMGIDAKEMDALIQQDVSRWQKVIAEQHIVLN